MNNNILAIIFTLAFIPLTTYAEFRCDGQLIMGFSKFDVLRYCGEPIMKDSYLKSGKTNNYNDINSIVFNQVQQWYYTRTFRNTSYTVEFESGNVIRIIDGEDAP